MKRRALSLLSLLLTLCLLLGGCVQPAQSTSALQQPDGMPAYTGEAYAVLNNNQPQFTAAERTTTSFEAFSPLDALGRCGVASACVGRDIMPTEERSEIGQVKPSGWHTVKYDIVSGKYLYNRCHLIGYQLTGENANAKNLITGTRYLNVDGMLPFENMVADYVKETGNHVLYRVTPLYIGNNLLASGVTMEAYSVEDNGEGICFYVYVYNVQPGIAIDYATGESALTEDGLPSATQGSGTTTAPAISGAHYVLNTNSKTFHDPDCTWAAKISEQNRQDFTGDRADLIRDGYDPCGTCKP